MTSVMYNAGRFANRLVIRLSKKLKEPDKLAEIVFSTAIGFTFLGAGMCFLQELEKLSPHVVHDTDISFELNVPVPEIKPSPAVTPQQPRRDTSTSSNRSKLLENGANRPRPALTATSLLQNENQQPEKTLEKQYSGSPDAAIAAPLPVRDPGVELAATTSCPPSSQAETARAESADTNQAPPATNPNLSQPTSRPQTDLNAVAGSDFGAQKTLAIAAAAPRMGNIKPYQIDLIARLAKNWKAVKGSNRMLILVTIGKDGSVLDTQMLQGSGSSKADQQAIAQVQSTEFAPLPDWYKGEHLACKLDLSTIVKER